MLRCAKQFSRLSSPVRHSSLLSGNHPSSPALPQRWSFGKSSFSVNVRKLHSRLGCACCGKLPSSRSAASFSSPLPKNSSLRHFSSDTRAPAGEEKDPQKDEAGEAAEEEEAEVELEGFFRGRKLAEPIPHESDAALVSREIEYDWKLEMDERFKGIPQTGPRKDLHPIHRGHYTPGARVAPKSLAQRLPLYQFVYVSANPGNSVDPFAPAGDPGNASSGQETAESPDGRNLSLALQTKAAVARFYPVSQALLDRLPEGFQKPLSVELMESGGFLMQRQAAFDLVQQLKLLGTGELAEEFVVRETERAILEYEAARESGEVNPDNRQQFQMDPKFASPKGKTIGITGQAGCGKSVTLLQAAMYARSAGHLVIPSWGPDIWNDLKGFIRPSVRTDSLKRHPRGLYEQARFTAAWFGNLLVTSAPELKQVKLRRSYPYWEPLEAEEALRRRRYRRRVQRAALGAVINSGESQKRDQEFWDRHCAEVEEEVKKTAGTKYPGSEGKTLFDLAQHAARNEDDAPDILYDFVWEIQRTQDIPVTVLVDNLNSWDTVSDFNEAETMKRLDRRQLCMVDAFARLQERPPRNGTFIFALNTSHETLKRAKLHLDKAQQFLRIEPYTDKELSQTLVHYSASGIHHQEVTRRFIARVKGFTGGAGRDVHEYSWLM